MSDALAAIVAAYRAMRPKDWRQIRQVPLVHGVEALTRVGTPFALAADEAEVVRDAAATFTRRFPKEYDLIRLCGLDYGLNAIIGALATVEAEDEDSDRGTLPGRLPLHHQPGADGPPPRASSGRN